jgi:hypothetical protein
VACSTTISLSTSALAACSRAAQDLQQLGITSEEKEIIEQSKTIEAVEDFIAQYIAEVDKKHHHDKTWKKVYAFSQFASPVLEIFKQANFSPECSIALGLVGMLLIQVRNRPLACVVFIADTVLDCLLALKQQVRHRKQTQYRDRTTPRHAFAGKVLEKQYSHSRDQRRN